MKMKNNNGFSLIELIVTIAIMAVVLGGSVSVFHWINTSRLETMAKNINYMLSDVRSDTLAKSGKYRMKLYANGDMVYAVEQKENGTDASGNPKWDDIEKKEVGKYGSVYVMDATGVKREINSTTSGSYVIVSYNKSDGSYNEINVYENTDTLGATPKGINSNEICTEYGDRNRKIKMIKQTGKHSIK